MRFEFVFAPGGDYAQVFYRSSKEEVYLGLLGSVGGEDYLKPRLDLMELLKVTLQATDSPMLKVVDK